MSGKTHNQDSNTLKLHLHDLSYEQIMELCGSLDAHLELIETAYQIKLTRKNSSLYLQGDTSKVLKSKKALLTLIEDLKSGHTIDRERVNHVLYQEKSQKKSRLFVTPANNSQKEYLNKIYHHTLTIGVGPAGTGKTHLAVAQAVSLYKQQVIEKIILTRPAVEAGEQLGFLPGDMSQKVDPFLRPLFDSLNEFLGATQVAALIEKGVIEIAPLAFMRGRTMKNAFIILDEAQNTTVMQMKMFLTRFGDNSKVVVTGDKSQIDLPSHQKSGLIHALALLKNIEGIALHHFSNQDVIRHPLVAKILDAYDRDSQLQERQNSSRKTDQFAEQLSSSSLA